MARVVQWGKPQGFVNVAPDATKGATLGVDLRWPDGTLVEVADFTQPVAAAIAATSAAASAGGTIGSTIGGGSTGIGGPVMWGLIASIPPNVSEVEGLATAGFVRRDGAGAWTATPIVNADLSGASTTGLAEGTNLYYTDARADARVAIGISNHEAALDPHPQYLDHNDVIDGGNF